MISFFINIVKGACLGAGAILPGISSGVLCVIFGFYEKLVNSVLGIFKNFKDSIKFLLPICIGGFLGILLFGNILKYLFSSYPISTNFAFMGLILGSIPILFKKGNNNKSFKIKNLLYTLFAFFITLILLCYEKNFKSISVLNSNDFSFIYLFLSGFLMSIGVIVPGVSSTVILMCLGVYSSYLEAIANLDIRIFNSFSNRANSRRIYLVNTYKMVTFQLLYPNILYYNPVLLLVLH